MGHLRELMTKRWRLAIMAIPIGLALALAGSSTVLGTVDNDAFAAATPIETLPFVDEGVDVALAGVEPDEPRPSCAPLRHTAWYVVDRDADTALSIQAVPDPTAGAAFDIGLAAWQAGPDGSLIEVGCVDQQGPGAPERLTFAATRDVPHYVQVGAIVRADTIVGPFSLRADIQQPEHDLFAFARPIEVTPYTDEGVDAVVATRETGEPEPSCAEMVATTWYRLTPDENTVLRARVTPAPLGGNIVDAAIAVYSGTSLASLVELACVDAGGVQASETVDVSIAGGDDFFIQVGAVLGADAWPGVFTFSVAGSQVIELEPVTEIAFGDDPLALTAEATSGLPVAFSTSGPCSVTASRLTPSGAGTCAVTASQAGDADWAPAPAVTVTIDIGKAVQTIDVIPPDDAVVGEPVEVTAASDSGLPVSLEVSGPCVADGPVVLPIATGMCTVTASQEGDADWVRAPGVTTAFDIDRAPQKIEVGPVGEVTFGDDALAIFIRATSGLPVSLKADGPCTVIGDSLSFDGAGTCTLTSSQSGGDAWAPAPDVTLAIDITKAPQFIRFPPLPAAIIGERPISLPASASSGLPIIYASSRGCRVEAGVIIPLTAGKCTVTAAQGGDVDWQAAESRTRELRILAFQTIDFGPIADVVFGDGPLSLAATASSGLPVSFAAVGPCEVDGGTLQLAGAGRCVISASQPGDSDWAPAEPVLVSVAIAKADQTIEFPTLADVTFGDGPVSLTATATSGMPVSYAAEGPCAVDGIHLTIEGAGTCIITASQPGGSDYREANDVVRRIRVARALQAISFEMPERGFLGALSVALGASTSSGLSPSYTVSGPCRVDDATLRFIDGGDCTVTVSQSGDADHLPAEDASRTIRIVTPITGRRKNFVGKVATDPPGTYVGSGARITSALEPGGRTTEYYAIDLTPGDVVEVDISSKVKRLAWAVLSPTDATSMEASWHWLDRDKKLDVHLGRRLAIEPGVYVIGIHDLRGRRAGSPYSYTIGFMVVPGDTEDESQGVASDSTGVSEPSTGLANDAPITGRRKNFVGKVATEPPGTYVGSGASITSALEPGRRATEYYAIDLTPGDIVEVDISAGVKRLAWAVLPPSEATSMEASWQWLERDKERDVLVGRRLAIEQGIYVIGIHDLKGRSTGSPYSYTIRVTVVPADQDEEGVG